MKKLIATVTFGFAAASFAIAPAMAGKVTAWDGRDKITVGGKTYEVSGKRTKVTIGGAASSRDYLKAGMDCSVSGPAGGEATAITCK
jgi:hypothetical protein